MTFSARPAEFAAPELSGDTQEFLATLGEPTALPTLADAAQALALDSIRDAASLEKFLHGYREQILRPLELPAILAAHQHAARNELRELIVLDNALFREARLKEFRAASLAVGRRQLAKLRPLRDQRFVQRYLRAVEDGEAHGWHTLVFGVFLAQYSLPLRQGLLLYSQRTLGGFLASASGPLQLELATTEKIFTVTTEPLAPAVSELLAPVSL